MQSHVACHNLSQYQKYVFFLCRVQLGPGACVVLSLEVVYSLQSWHSSSLDSSKFLTSLLQDWTVFPPRIQVILNFKILYFFLPREYEHSCPQCRNLVGIYKPTFTGVQVCSHFTLIPHSSCRIRSLDRRLTMDKKKKIKKNVYYFH